MPAAGADPIPTSVVTKNKMTSRRCCEKNLPLVVRVPSSSTLGEPLFVAMSYHLSFDCTGETTAPPAELLLVDQGSDLGVSRQ
jgi:hypothetical protein